MWWMAVVAAEEVRAPTYTALDVADCSIELVDRDLAWSGQGATVTVQGTTLRVTGQRNADCHGRAGGILATVKARDGAEVRAHDIAGDAVLLQAESGASIEVEGSVRASKLEIQLSGGGSLTTQGGRARFGKISLSEASSLRSTVVVEHLKIDILGASAAEIDVIQSLEARVFASSTLAYAGTPNERKVKADLTSTVSAR